MIGDSPYLEGTQIPRDSTVKAGLSQNIYLQHQSRDLKSEQDGGSCSHVTLGMRMVFLEVALSPLRTLLGSGL